MNVYFSDSFRRDFKDLSAEIKKIAEQKIQFFLNNPRHPSLHTKKIQGTRDIWEGRITQNYRFTFQVLQNVYRLRRVGTHAILNREAKF